MDTDTAVAVATVSIVGFICSLLAGLYLTPSRWSLRKRVLYALWAPAILGLIIALGAICYPDRQGARSVAPGSELLNG